MPPAVLVMGIIIILSVIILVQMFRMGLQHDTYKNIHDAKDSNAVQRLTEKYQLRLKQASENLPQTLVTSPDAVHEALSEAFTPEGEAPKKAPVRAARRRSAPPTSES
jgi:hypothetical protein